MTQEFREFKDKLKWRYKNGVDRIGRDFVSPCLKHAVLYRRGTGFFSGNAMLSYVEAMDHLFDESTKIEILCSPVISDKSLLRALEQTSTIYGRERVLREITRDLVANALTGYKNTAKNPNARRLDAEQYKRDLLAYLLAKNILEVRFAVPKSMPVEDLPEEGDMQLSSFLYHVKTGYFSFPNGEKVAFEGSFNESEAGHYGHIDHTLVFRSWVESEQTSQIAADIDADWDMKNEYVQVFKMGAEALELARRLSPNRRPKRDEYVPKEIPKSAVSEKDATGLRDYQRDALERWRDNKYRGILAMATGTGKTRTAIEGIERFRAKAINGLVVVTVPTRPLAYQWCEVLSERCIPIIRVFEDKAGWIESVSNHFQLHSYKSLETASAPVLVCVNKSFEGDVFQGFLNKLSGFRAQRLIVVDECHHFNKRNRMESLQGSFDYRLGLSATPYETDEPRILEQYFGSIVFEYPLRQAIENKFLCPYFYHPVFIELSETEASKYVEVSKTIFNQKNKGGNDSESRGGALDEVLEGNVAKLAKLDELIERSGPTPHTLFYCGVGNIYLDETQKVRQLDSLARILNKKGWKFSKITHEESGAERESTVREFKMKSIDAISSIRVLDEGVDIPDCRRAYILASQRSERQGIQRRGRILRKADGKERADLYDFIVVGPHSTEAALVNLYDKELRRAKLFSEDAMNREECLNLISKIV